MKKSLIPDLAPAPDCLSSLGRDAWAALADARRSRPRLGAFSSLQQRYGQQRGGCARRDAYWFSDERSESEVICLQRDFVVQDFRAEGAAAGAWRTKFTAVAISTIDPNAFASALDRAIERSGKRTDMRAIEHVA